MSYGKQKSRLNLITSVIEGKLSELKISTGSMKEDDPGESILKRIQKNSGAAVNYRKYLSNQGVKSVVLDLVRASNKASALSEEEMRRTLEETAENLIHFNYLKERLLNSVPKIGGSAEDFDPKLTKEEVDILIKRISTSNKIKLDSLLSKALEESGIDKKEAFVSADLSDGKTDNLEDLDEMWADYYKENRSISVNENFVEEVSEEDENISAALSELYSDSESEYKVKDFYNNYDPILSSEKIRFKKMEDMFGQFYPKTFNEYSDMKSRKDATDFINKLVSEIRSIKAHNISDEETGLLSGEKISRKNIHRIKTDMKVFEKVNVEEEEEAELSIYIGLDFSGSTSDGLDKQIQTVGIALTETLERLGIMHTIIPYNSCVTIATRGKERSKSKYSLAGAGVRGFGGNNEDQLLKTISILSNQDKEEDILVIIITDGDGSGELTGLEFIKQHADGKIIKVHSVGLAYDGGTYTLDRAQKIYGKNYAHRVTAKNEMHRTIGKIVKQSVLRKEGNNE